MLGRSDELFKTVTSTLADPSWDMVTEKRTLLARLVLLVGYVGHKGEVLLSMQLRVVAAGSSI